MTLSPLIGYICISILNISYTYLMISIIAFTAILQFIDPIKFGKYRFPKYFIYFSIFVIYTIYSDLFIAGHSLTIKYLYKNEFLGCVLALFIVENYSYSKTRLLKNINFWLVLTIFIALIVILIQEVSDEMFFVFEEHMDNDIDRYNYIETRLPSIFSWTGILDIGFVFVPILSLVLDNLFYKKRNTMPIYYIIGAIVVFLSRNRWIMVNYLVLFFMYLSYYSANIKNVVKYLIGIAIVLYLSIIILDLTNVPVKQIIDDRILEKSKGGLGEGSAGSRIFAFQVFAKLFPKHMILGKGMLHSFGGESKDFDLTSALEGRSSQIHVGYLSLFYYYGLIGGAIYLIFIYLLFKKLLKDARVTMHWGPFYGFLGFILANFTLVSLPFFNAGLILCLFFNKIFLNYDEKVLQSQPVET